MTLASPARDAAADQPVSSGPGVRTSLADRTRAIVQVTGDLEPAGVAALERLLDEHYVAGRRFLRISIAGVRELSSAFVALLERTHYRMLARRGTSIITGAGPEVMRTLSELGLDEVLLVVETCADEHPYAGMHGAVRSRVNPAASRS